ncbi:MAG: hypothetical protein ACI9U2_003947, partial [Bradymonadia bacterium]
MSERAALVGQSLAGLGELVVQARVEAQDIVDQRNQRPIALTQPSKDGAHRERIGAGLDQVRCMKVGVEAPLNPRHRCLNRVNIGFGVERLAGNEHIGRGAGLRHQRHRQRRRRSERGPQEAELSYDHAVKRHGPTILYAWLLCTALGVGLAHADAVRLTVEGPGVPYAQAEYVVAEKRGTVVAESNKRFAERFGRQELVAVLTRADLDALLDALKRDGVWSLRTRRAARRQTRWTIVIT